MKDPIWAIIAARNEEENIRKVIFDTKKYVEHVLVINDGSTDNTGPVAQKAGATVLTHIVNLGKGAAVTTGCEYAIPKGASIIILLDADGQHEPKEIPRMIEKLKDSEIVFGIRTKRKSMPALLKFGNWAITLATRVLYGVQISDTQCGFRAFRAKAYPKIRWKSTGYSMESEMIANVGKKRLKYSEIPISTIYSDRYKGTTVFDGIQIVWNMIWWKLSR